MTEPTTSAAVFSALGGVLMAVFGVDTQVVMVALIGTALFLLISDADPEAGRKGRLKVLALSACSIIVAAIAAHGLAVYFEVEQAVENGMALLLAVCGPYLWRKAPEWIAALFQRFTR